MNSNQTHLTVTRTVDVPAKDLFDLLTLPARHPEFDGSGTVRSADDTERIPEAEDGTAPTEPLGWEWLYELKSRGAGSTEVSLTYDWSRVTDQKLLEKVGFPAIPETALEESLNLLAAAVTKS